ncbi:MAG: hypothetical protein N2Z21_07550, partial [Candidatus Sumerlaeaceae bacterium]|nr:hypothetical protein [Candidatus Sumerlaeaceae bacterium]
WRALSFIPVLAIGLARWARYHLYPVGVGLSLSQQMATALWVHVIFCVPYGYLLVRLCQRLSQRIGPYAIGQSYYLDAFGSIIGGLLFVYPLSHYFGQIQIVSAAGGAFLLTEVFCSDRSGHGRWWRRIWPAIFGAGLISAGFVADKPTLPWLIPSGQLAYEGRSPYGQILVARMGDQRVYFRNGAMLFSTNLPESVEQYTHLPLLAHSQPERVLVTGPPLAEVAAAILQHPVREVLFVQPDAALAEALIACGDAANDVRCRAIVADPRNFLTHHPAAFDVIIQTESLPTTLLANRYFTREFASVARRSLRQGGVFSLSLGEFANYFDATRASLIASIARAIREEFRFVAILPGDRLVLVASDLPLNLNFRSALEARQLRTWFVRPGYLTATVEAPDRQQAIARVLSTNVAPNTDAFPMASRLVLMKWLEEYGLRLGPLALIIAGLIVIFLVRMRGAHWPVFAAGMSASGLEYVGLTLVQSVVGTIYYLAPFLVTIFMAGLLGGVVWTNRAKYRPKISHVVLGYCVFCACVSLFTAVSMGVAGLPASWVVRATYGYMALIAIWALILFTLGMLTSAIFSLAGLEGGDDLHSRASWVYAADFVGGAIGAVVFAVVLLPSFGVTAAALVTSVVMGAILLVRRLISQRPAD